MNASSKKQTRLSDSAPDANDGHSSPNMTTEKPKMSVRTARKRLIAFIAVGVFLIALSFALPSLLHRWHFHDDRYASWRQWRFLSTGLILIFGSAYALFKFRHEKD